MVPDAQNSNIREMDTGLRFQGQCQLHTNFKANLDYMTACLKINPTRGKRETKQQCMWRSSKWYFSWESHSGIGKDPEWKMGLEFSSANRSHQRGQTEELMERKQGLEGNGDNSYNSFEGMWV